MSRRSRTRLFSLLALALAFLAPTPARAHKQAMKLAITQIPGSTSPVQLRKAGGLSITPFGGGTVMLAIKDVRDSNGTKLTALGNELRLDLRVNGVPTSVAYPFDIKNGRGNMRSVLTPTEDLYKGDRVELLAVDIVDANDVSFATLGVPPGTRTPIMKSSLVYVIDSASDVRFSLGGDTRLKLRDNGNFNTGFDKLLDPAGAKITVPDVKVELEVIRNDGASEVFSYTYDIVHGRSVPNGRPHVELGFQMTETIRVRRLDVFDNLGNRFATLGLKIITPRLKVP